MKKAKKIYGVKGFSVGDRASSHVCIGSLNGNMAIYGVLGKGSTTMSERWAYLGAFRTRDR